VSLPERVVTERLVARCWRPADAPLLKAAIDASLAHLQPWMPWAMNEPSPLEAIAERLARFEHAFRAGEEWLYGLFAPDEREVLGGVGVHRRGEPDQLELGYWARANVEGRGYVTEAARALADVAASQEGVARLTIRCDPRNVRSAAVAARLGFRHVATLAADAVTPDGARRETMVWERAAETGRA
jgi:RimJ/RimL family protein N-acetyltransferase